MNTIGRYTCIARVPGYPEIRFVDVYDDVYDDADDADDADDGGDGGGGDDADGGAYKEICRASSRVYQRGPPRILRTTEQPAVQSGALGETVYDGVGDYHDDDEVDCDAGLDVVSDVGSIVGSEVGSGVGCFEKTRILLSLRQGQRALLHGGCLECMADFLRGLWG